MKILYIAPLPPPTTGQSLAAEALLAHFKAMGHQVTSLNISKKTFQQGVNSMGRVGEVFSLIWSTMRAGRSFDLVYLTTAESVPGNLKDLLLLLVIGGLQRRTWLHLHGGAGMRRLLVNRNSWLGKLNAFFLNRVAGIIVLGERISPIFAGYVPSERIHIVKNFAEENLYLSTELAEQKWKATHPIRVLFLSNLLPGKGHSELLEAIKKLPISMKSNFQFDFAGGFESDADRREFLKEIEALPSVRYHGLVHGETKRALLAAAHVFCLPTFYPYEGQPISILEAYASACVVLTTDHSGIFDIFTPGKNGLEVRPRDPESILTALLTIASDQGQASAWAWHNRVEADLLFTKQAHLKQMSLALGLEVAT